MVIANVYWALTVSPKHFKWPYINLTFTIILCRYVIIISILRWGNCSTKTEYELSQITSLPRGRSRIQTSLSLRSCGWLSVYTDWLLMPWHCRAKHPLDQNDEVSQNVLLLSMTFCHLKCPHTSSVPNMLPLGEQAWPRRGARCPRGCLLPLF